MSCTIDKNSQAKKSSEVSSRKQVQKSSIVYITGRRICSEDQNNLDKGTMSVEPKGPDKVPSDNKLDLDSLYDGITNLQGDGLVIGTEPKGSATVSDSKTVRQYDKTTLRSRKKSKGNLTGGNIFFSRAAKQQEHCLLWKGKMTKHTALDRKKMLSQ